MVVRWFRAEGLGFRWCFRFRVSRVGGSSFSETGSSVRNEALSFFRVWL